MFLVGSWTHHVSILSVSESWGICDNIVVKYWPCLTILGHSTYIVLTSWQIAHEVVVTSWYIGLFGLCSRLPQAWLFSTARLHTIVHRSSQHVHHNGIVMWSVIREKQQHDFETYATKKTRRLGCELSQLLKTSSATCSRLSMTLNDISVKTVKVGKGLHKAWLQRDPWVHTLI